MTKKIKVMHFVGGLNVGGAQTLIKDYLINLDKKKFDVVLLCLGSVKESPYIEELGRDRRIRVIYADKKSPFRGNKNIIMRIANYFYRFFAVRSVIKDEKPDILHTHLMVSVYTKFARPRRGTAMFYTVHSDPDRIWLKNTTLRQKSDFKAIKWLVRKYNMKIIVLHAAMKKKVDVALGISDSIVLNNGVDLSKYKITRDSVSVRKKINIPEDAFVVGHVGRMVKVKNQTFLVKIFAKICTVRDDALLLIVGEGPEKNELMQNLRQYGLLEKCVMLSDRNDIPDLLATMDVFVLPSLVEGLPVSLIEAQESGLPCFVSDNISSHAFISNLVEPMSLSDNADVWAEAILNYRRPNYVIMNDEEWDIKKIVKKIEHIYLSELANNGD